MVTQGARRAVRAAVVAAAAVAAVIAWGVHQGATEVGALVAAGVWLAIPVAVVAWGTSGTSGGVGDRAVASVRGWLYLAAAVALALAVMQMPPGTSAFATTARDAAFLVRVTAPAAFVVGLVPVLVPARVAGAPRAGDRSRAKSGRADPRSRV